MIEDISNGTKAISGEGNGIRRECTGFISKAGWIDKTGWLSGEGNGMTFA